MIALLDDLLRAVLLAEVPGITSELQVRFQPPDDDWRANYVPNLTVGGQPANSLNVYLADLRENRKLRSNERVRTVAGGVATEEPAPDRVDCHYLISAWSPATVSPALEPTADEHTLLYDVTAALMHHAPLNPSRVYPPASAALSAWPARFQEMDLPTTVLPTEGFAKLAEFWQGMGTGGRWKPALYLIVTLPVEMLAVPIGGIVTTRITEYRRIGQPGTAEVLIQIGGTVLDPAGQAVVGAWVRLETPAGDPLQTTETDALGRFTFAGLRAGGYRLRTRVAGLGERDRAVDVPSNSGEYDLRFP